MEDAEMKTFLEILEEVLTRDERLLGEDGIILKSKAYDFALTGDATLLSLLLSNDALKQHFFKDINGVMVFDSIKFGWVVSSKEFLPNSYTQYKNKIGLVNNKGISIYQSNDVCLVWPYKDCVLEGGQTKEDQKRAEVFYNETLAPDEVNRLLYPKVFTNAKRYTKAGVERALEFSDTDNLIIKGNNLLALSSLLKRYEGRVKCIYIDPPYNTGNDSFRYNDNFNHSSWLTFIKNRLEIAKKLLRNDGTIAISVDNYELAYMLILLDEIFGKENRKNIITIKRGSVTGAKVINPGVVNVAEYVLLYSSKSSNWKPNRVYAAKGYDDRYGNFICNYEQGYDNWNFTTVLEAFANECNLKKSQLKKHFADEYENRLEKFVYENAERIIQFATLDDNSISQEARLLKEQSMKNPDKVILFEREDAKPYYILNGKLILFAKDRLLTIDGKLSFSQPITDIWDDVLPNDLHNEGGVELRKGKKPEKLISRILEICSNEKDIVLDFFVGSGTTAAVSHKMGRQYICVEQMDYVETTTVERLINTINGEQRGISQSVNWQGGGSFVYCELKELNEKFINKLQVAADAEIVNIIEEIKATGFVSQKILPKDIDVTAKDFADLSFEDKRNLACEIINKNLLYLNLCDIDDEEFMVTEEEKAFTNSFYGRG